MITKIIKSWLFDEASRKLTEIITSDKARLNTEDPRYPRLQLKAIEERYSTDADIIVKTKSTKPQAVRKWLMFEYSMRTNERDFKECSAVLADKTGNQFSFSSSAIRPVPGDRVYQGDYTTFISDVSSSNVTLSDATNFENGRVHVLRSKCDVQFRIYDENGTQWFYDTSSGQWANAGVGDWNSGFVISNHLAELDLAAFGKEIGFYINLKTDDEKYTPYLDELKLLGEFDINFAEDIVYESVIRAMEDHLRALTVIELYLSEDTDTINIAEDAEYELENDGYNIVDGEAVYNLNSDPGKVNNIFDSYTPGAPRGQIGNDPGQIKLSSVQSADSLIRLQMQYFPEIAVNTHLDSYEVNKRPSLVFERIEKANTTVAPDAGHIRNFIRDKLTLTGVQLEPPEQYDLIFGYAVFTGNQSDQHRLGEALHRFFVNVHHINSWGLDHPYPILVREEFRSTNQPNASNVNTHVGEFRICNVCAFIKEPKDVPLVDWLTKRTTTN